VDWGHTRTRPRARTRTHTHTHTHTGVLSLLQFPIFVAWQQILPMEILYLPCSRRYCPANIPQLHSAGLGSSLYRLGANQRKNTTSDSPSAVVMGGCLPIALLSLTCLPSVTKQRTFLLTIVAYQRYYMLHYNKHLFTVLIHNHIKFQ
jgi:hypothetical protein